MDIEIQKLLTKLAPQDRIESRCYARLLATKDGQLFMASLKRDIGWDTAGPSSESMERTNGQIKTIVPAANRDEWIGQRQVIQGIIEKALIGKKLIDNEIED